MRKWILYKAVNKCSYINRQTSHFKVRSGQLEHIIYKFPGTFHVLFLLVVPFRRFQCSVISLKSRKSQSSSPPKDLFRCNNKANDKRLGTLLYCLYCYIGVGVCYLKGIAQYFKNMNHNCSCYGCGYSHMDNVVLPQMLFIYFASKNQLPGFFISGTLVENGLMQ